MKSEKNTGLTVVAPKGQEPAGSFLGHLWASIAFTITLGIVACVVYPAIVWAVAHVVFPNQANGSLVKKDGTPTTDDTQAVGSYLLGQPFSAPGYFTPRPSAAGAGYDPTSSGGSNLGPLSDKLINGATNAATTQPTTQPESLAYDGVRLRTIEYAMNNGISFKLYTVSPDGSTRTEVPLSKYQNADGSLNDVALVDAFPHPESDPSDKSPLIAADFSTPIPADAVTASGSGLDPHISPENAKLQIARVAKTRDITPDQVQALIDAHTDQPGLGILGDPGVNVLMLNLALDAKYPVPAPPATQPAATPATQPTTQP
ncbi:MAG: potassium-transporting ATPase subunit C [Tepidisphaeraceae bacterium]|jgi:K+-transporting ATPase ATPase C chain